MKTRLEAQPQTMTPLIEHKRLADRFNEHLNEHRLADARAALESRRAELRLYPEGKVLCPKCGCAVTEATLFREAHPCVYEGQFYRLNTPGEIEHLRWTCKCGYSFATKTKDAE